MQGAFVSRLGRESIPVPFAPSQWPLQGRLGGGGPRIIGASRRARPPRSRYVSRRTAPHSDHSAPRVTVLEAGTAEAGALSVSVSFQVSTNQTTGTSTTTTIYFRPLTYTLESSRL